jgi:hypothetical protein
VTGIEPPRTVIIHGIRITKELVSPRAGRSYADLWGLTRCNQKYWGGRLTDWTEWFDMHPLESSGEWLGIRARRPEAWAWYAEQEKGRPIWMAAHHPQIAASQRFPLEALQQHFPVVQDLAIGVEPCRQFTCMLDYVIAFAIYRGYRRIVLNGIGFATDAGHQFVHRGILYWIGFARGLGVEVLVDAPSVYRMPEQLYGYERFGFDELRQIRRALTEAQIAARRRGRPAPGRSRLAY